jgi:hypothetical protein
MPSRETVFVKAMNELYLVRHGNIDKSSMLLDDDGKKLSQDLIDIFKDKKIDIICSSSETRCIETVLPLAKIRHLPIKTYHKNEVIALQPLHDIKSVSNGGIIICYRIEEVREILNALLNENIEMTSQKAYEVIMHLSIDNGRVIRKQEILTGHTKNTD